MQLNETLNQNTKELELRINALQNRIVLLENENVALLASEKKFKSIAENSQDYIMRYDHKYRHVYENPAALKVSGLKEEDIIGKTHREAGFSEELSKLWEEKISYVFMTGKSSQSIFEWESISGKVYLDWRLYPEFNEHGDVSTVLGISRDISEQKKAQNKLKISEERLKQEVYVKNRFFSIIAHDLRSPFQSLFGMTQIISEMADSFSKEELTEYAKKLDVVGKRFFELLENLLTWSRLQMEGAKQEPKMIQLAKLTQESMNVLNPTALEKDISLANNINNVCAFADQDMVRTVILNLITNSIKFSLSGGSVGVSASNNGNLVQVTVTDTGVGMSEDQAKNIFSLDQKRSTKGTAGEVGTGLGLPLCKEMIERNKGEIWAESTPGEGSLFHFTLPITPSE